MAKFWTCAFAVAAAMLFVLFFSNDFGLIDIQKTAIVAAIGIDAERSGPSRKHVGKVGSSGLRVDCLDPG